MIRIIRNERGPRRIGRDMMTLLGAALLLGGCNSSLKEQNTHLTEENRGLRGQLVDRNQALETMQGELRDRESRVAQLEQELQDARWSAANQPAPVAAPTARDPFSGIEGVTGSVGKGEITATVASDVLFDSGKATLKSSAKRSLDAVARVLRDEYAGRTIRVAGHTDTDPIRKSGHKSNYHLAFERAFAVREYLVERGVPATRVYLASHGPDRSRGSKKESRRVDIAVVLNE